MMGTLTEKQFLNICRCCLEPKDNKNPLFPLFLQQGQYGRYAKNTNASLLEIIKTCLGLTIDPFDGLPMDICATCEKSLIKMHIFRSNCLKSAEKLRSMKNTVVESNESKLRVRPHNELMSDTNEECNDMDDIHIEELEFVPVGENDVDAQAWASATAVDAKMSSPSIASRSYSLRASSGIRFSPTLCAPSESESDPEYAPIVQKKTAKRKTAPVVTEEDKPDEPNTSKRRVVGEQSQLIIRRLDMQQRKMDLLIESLSNSKPQTDSGITLNPDIVLPDIPMTNPEQLDFMNTELLKPLFLEQMVLHLQHAVYSGSLKVKVKLLFETLMTYELAVMYTWSGVGAHLSDGSLQCNRLPFYNKVGFKMLFKRFLEYRSPLITVDEKELKHAMQDFIKRAKYRMEQRNVQKVSF